MCIGIPMRVVEPHGLWAWCEGREGRRRIDLALVGPQPEGAWLLTFLDAAREVLDAASAGALDRALDALAAVLQGDASGVDAAFADLAREPRLPQHLLAGKETP